MKPETGKLLQKARRAIDASRALLDRNDTDFAAGRAYYAMFYVAEALLFEKDLKFRKHSGVQSAFGEHFAKTGILDAKFHRFLLEAGSKRLTGDYGIEIILSRQDVLEMIAQPEEFVSVAEAFLDS